MNDMIQTLAVYALPVLFAITLHEAAHAFAAKYFGDSTAYSLGRMTWNPLKHIDPIGTLLLPIGLYLVGSPFLFGYAKPVPVDFGRLRNPKKQMVWVALAGPAANLVMAFGWLLLAALLLALHLDQAFFMQMTRAGVLINLVLLAFNLFPIPPLDGGRILTGLLPYRYAVSFSKLERYGFVIIIGLMFLNVLQYWVYPVMMLANGLLQILLYPFTFFLS